MKTILLAESEPAELKTLMDICRLGPQDYSILTARDGESTTALLKDQHVDLVLCSTVFPDTQDCQVAARIAHNYPYIPVIALAPSATVDPQQLAALGISALCEQPLEAESLRTRIEELLETSSTGTVKGIPIHSFLQMLESEGKTCTLHVFSNDKSGLIYIKDGMPINAETSSLASDEAIYEIISWNEVIIDIRFFNGLKKTTITKPLISLIMEGFRLKDERETKIKQEQTIVKPKHKLKQVPTAGHSLALDIGMRLKVEFETIEPTLESTLVGLVPDNFVIISTPSHFVITGSHVEPETNIIVKYMYLGKLCLFKSKIARVIGSPHHLIILDYPAVIHYHEMRKARRTAIYIPCALVLPDGGKYFGTFLDLSTAGGLCQIKTKSNQGLPDVQIRQEVRLDCLLPGVADEQQLNGAVRNYKTTGDDIHLGIEFIGLPASLKEIIERYLVSIEDIEA